MTPPTVIWMRHGICTDGYQRPDAYARPDSPLHPIGTEQVTASARALLAESWRPELIVTSTLPRTVATAEVMASLLRIATIHRADVLREWAAPTCVLGVGPHDYPHEYRTWRQGRLTHIDTALPGGESLQAVRDRAATALKYVTDLADRYRDVLVVSHRILIGCVAALHAGTDDPAQVFERASRFSLAPAGLWRPHSSG